MKITSILMLSLCLGAAAARASVAGPGKSADGRADLDSTLNEIVVTGLAGSVSRSHSPAPVSVITRKEWQRSSFSNIIDAVAHEPGVAQITTGSGISKPVIRGLGYNRIVVVQGGVRQEGQQWGDEHGIEIDASSISSVEILKGPASLMFGSDALAGVLILHDETAPMAGMMRVEASTEYQTNNGLFGWSLDMAGNKGGFLWNVRYSDKMAHAYKNKADGYVYNSGFREHAATAMAGINRHWGFSHLKLSLYSTTPGIVEGERDSETGDFIKTVAVDGEEVEQTATENDFTTYHHRMPYQKVTHYKATWDNSIDLGGHTLKAIVAYQMNRRKEFEEALSPDECSLDFLLHTVSYDFRLQSREFSGWRLSLGVGGMWQRSLNRGEEYLIPAYSLFDFGIFTTATKTFHSVTLSGGLRFDTRHINSHRLIEDGEERFPAFSRNFNGVAGSLGMVWNVSRGVDFRLNIARGYRAPNISELASNGVHEGTVRYEQGNSSLKAEHSWQVDAGVDISTQWLYFQLSLFANRIDNYIFSEKVSSEDGTEILTDGYSTYRFVSGGARLLGGEALLDIHIIPTLHVENTFSYVSAVQLGQPEESKYLPMTPAPRWTCDIRWHMPTGRLPLSGAYVSAGLECNLRQSHYYAAGGTETATPSYTLFNASIGTDITVRGRRVASIAVTGSNLTDRAYQSHLSRLKYTDRNNATGRTGVYNMGRSIGFKLTVPLEWQ